MAGPEDKVIQTLEDELKVLKGEVKRTLVDLRALLMRADSPLSEGGDGVLGRRGAVPVPGQNAQPVASAEKGISGISVTVGQGVPGQVRVEEPPPPSDAPRVVRQNPSPSLVREATTEWVAPADFGEERAWEEGSQTYPERGTPRRDDVEEHPDGYLGLADEEIIRRYRQIVQDREPRARPGRDDIGEDEYLADGRHPQGRGAPQQKEAPNGTGRYRGRAGSPEVLAHNGDLQPRGQAGSRVYDEYVQLLEDAEGGGDDGAQGQMDLNQLASLMHWVTIAKQRVGEQRLKDLVELYLQSGHDSPGLGDLLGHLSSLAQEVPSNGNQHIQECLDLMLHLHGIVTGGLPVVKIPPIKLSGQ